MEEEIENQMEDEHGNWGLRTGVKGFVGMQAWILGRMPMQYVWGLLCMSTWKVEFNPKLKILNSSP